MIFLDNSSTTQVIPEVIDGMSDVMRNRYGNASSFHFLGISSEKIIREACCDIMNFIGAKHGKIYFTSGGTESNNLAIFGSINLKSTKNLVTSGIEHPSVSKPILKLQDMGANVSYIIPNKNFFISDDKLENVINEETNFISIMHVNNETGMIFPLEKISKIRRRKCPGAIFHVDAVQGFGKIPINVERLGIDFLSFSSHKIHGPKGIGALYSSERVKLNPIFLGGGQQNGIRPGTEPIELISGFHTSIKCCNINDRFSKVRLLNNYLRDKLQNISDIHINSPLDSSPYIVNFSVLGLKSEVLLNFLSERGICVSSASACSGNSKSKTLSSVGLEDNMIDSSIRVSFSFLNSIHDVNSIVDRIVEAKEILIHR